MKVDCTILRISTLRSDYSAAEHGETIHFDPEYSQAFFEWDERGDDFIQFVVTVMYAAESAHVSVNGISASYKNSARTHGYVRRFIGKHLQAGGALSDDDVRDDIAYLATYHSSKDFAEDIWPEFDATWYTGNEREGYVEVYDDDGLGGGAFVYAISASQVNVDQADAEIANYNDDIRDHANLRDAVIAIVTPY